PIPRSVRRATSDTLSSRCKNAESKTVSAISKSLRTADRFSRACALARARARLFYNAGHMRRRASLLIAVLAFIVFLPSIVPGELLCYDDDHCIPGAPAVRDRDVAKMLFTLRDRSDLGEEYLPVRDLTYALDSALWGVDGPRAARGFRFTNL